MDPCLEVYVDGVECGVGEVADGQGDELDTEVTGLPDAGVDGLAYAVAGDGAGRRPVLE